MTQEQSMLSKELVGLLNELAGNRLEFFRLCEQIENLAGYPIDDTVLEMVMDCDESPDFSATTARDFMEVVRVGGRERLKKRAGGQVVYVVKKPQQEKGG